MLSAFQQTVAEMGDAPAFGFESNDQWHTLSWNDYASQALAVAAGLRKYGINKGDRVILLTKNAPEFHVFDMALMLVGAIPVSVYNTPSVRPLAHILKDAGATACFVNDIDFAKRMVKAIEASELDPLMIINSPEAATIHGAVDYRSLIEETPLDLSICSNGAAASDIAVMLYTSGTSGPPKGVPLTHSNLVYAVDTFSRRSGVPLGKKRQLSYLPMAHIGERFATHYAHIASGSTVATCPDIGDLHRYLKETRPHMLFGAPRMWELLYDRIVTELLSTPDRSETFHAAIEQSAQGVATTAEKDLIQDVLAEYGMECIEVAIVGSAPLPQQVHRFWLACGLPLADYYGQTETTGMGSWDPHDITLGTVGKPLDGTEIRISDIGEIEISGPGVFSGYYNKPEKTQEAFTTDGWYKTGDLGRFDDQKNLIYQGRMNDMIVPTSGHNVSPIQIESLLTKHPFVSYACLVGTGRPHVGAVIVLNTQTLAQWLSEQGLSVNDVANSDVVAKEIDDHIAEINAELPGAERVRSRVLVTDDWDLDSATLTPTGKMKRVGVEARYADEIEAMYDLKRNQR